MRVTLSILFVFVVLGIAVAFAVTEDGTPLLNDRTQAQRDLLDPLASRGAAAERSSDTTWYGQYEVIGDQYYAIAFTNKIEGSWTFDRGTGPFDPPPSFIENGEGWSTRDHTEAPDYFSVIDQSLDLGQGVEAPVLSGEGSLWLGTDKPQADALCWPCGAGYGNDWSQRVVSEALAYNGSGSILIEFKYFSDTEESYDWIRLYLARSDETELLLTELTGKIGIDEMGSITPMNYAREITEQEIGDPQTIHLLFEFASDGGWSDEDCQYPTIKGPFAVDDITVTGGGIDMSYTFESGLEGWIPSAEPGVGDHAGIADIEDYSLAEVCGLSGNLLEMHEGTGNEGSHPAGQYVWVQSPICDLAGMTVASIFMEFDRYLDVPSGTMYRPGWKYYPWTCAGTGQIGWSPRVGGSAWYAINSLDCRRVSFPGTGEGLPPGAEMVVAGLEVMNADHVVSGFRPLFDNITVGVIGQMLLEDVADEAAPRGLEYRLFRNAPNPVNPTTTIEFSMASSGPVSIVIYDVNGRPIRTLFEGKKDAGLHSVVWDGTDDLGRPVDAGVYWSRMKTGVYASNKKMIVLK